MGRVLPNSKVPVSLEITRFTDSMMTPAVYSRRIYLGLLRVWRSPSTTIKRNNGAAILPMIRSASLNVLLMVNCRCDPAS